MKRPRTLVIAVVGGMLAASTGPAFADLTILSYEPTLPGGDMQEWTISHDFTQSFPVANTANPDFTKYIRLEVSMDENGLYPQNPGSAFQASTWPSVTASGSTTTIIAAYDVTGIYKTFGIEATIFPQPSSETFKIPDNVWAADQAHITSIDVTWVCIPEPPSTALVGARHPQSAGLLATAIRKGIGHPSQPSGQTIEPSARVARFVL